MRRPGFTILELVIALGVVVLLGGLAMPSLYERLGDSRLDAAGRDVAAVIAAVRADAMREGRVLEVRCDRDGDVVRLLSSPLDAASGPATPRATLPAGIDVRDTPPGPEPVDSPAPPPGGDEQTAHEAVVLGVLLPDGSAWSSEPAYLVLPSVPRRALVVMMNSWTGAVAVTELPVSDTYPEQEPVP